MESCHGCFPFFPFPSFFFFLDGVGLLLSRPGHKSFDGEIVSWVGIRRQKLSYDIYLGPGPARRTPFGNMGNSGLRILFLGAFEKRTTKSYQKHEGAGGMEFLCFREGHRQPDTHDHHDEHGCGPQSTYMTARGPCSSLAATGVWSIMRGWCFPGALDSNS